MRYQNMVVPIKISVVLIWIAAEFSVEKRGHRFLCCMVNLGLKHVHHLFAQGEQNFRASEQKLVDVLKSILCKSRSSLQHGGLHGHLTMKPIGAAMNL